MPSLRLTTVLVSILVLALSPHAVSTDIATQPVWFESVVEGHTVFQAIAFAKAEPAAMATPGPLPNVAPADMGTTANADEPGTLVERIRFPGVLWTNDQFLVPASMMERHAETGGPSMERNRVDFAAGLMTLLMVQDQPGGPLRTPCGGALLVVNAGDPDPRTGTTIAGLADQEPVYRESYLVTDPNDRMWITDVYTPEVGSGTVWVTNLGGGAVFTPDTGSACAAYDDLPPAGFQEPSSNGYCFAGTSADPGCTGAPSRRYNAVTYLKADSLEFQYPPVDHSDATQPYATNACSVGSSWNCPQDYDHQEGFSHPFRPAGATSSDACLPPWRTPGGTQANHGGSTSTLSHEWYSQSPLTSGKGSCDPYHATFNVDSYYSPTWRPAQPTVRAFAILDTNGVEERFGPQP